MEYVDSELVQYLVVVLFKFECVGEGGSRKFPQVKWHVTVRQTFDGGKAVVRLCSFSCTTFLWRARANLSSTVFSAVSPLNPGTLLIRATQLRLREPLTLSPSRTRSTQRAPTSAMYVRRGPTSCVCASGILVSGVSLFHSN